MIGAADGPARAGGHRHAPLDEIVDAGAPADRELSASVFGNVASDGAGPGAGGIGGKDETVFGGVFHGALGDDPGFDFQKMSAGGAAVVEREFALGDGADVVQFFGVHHDAPGAEGDGTAGQSGAGSAGNHLESEAGDC